MERLMDAEALLAGFRWDYAYYVSGYAVECALKSCVLARMIETGIVYKSEKPVDFRTHDFGKLVEQAGIKDDLNAELKASSAAGKAFVGYWNVVGGWSVESRYESSTEVKARELYAAITHDTEGVLQWLKNYW